MRYYKIEIGNRVWTSHPQGPNGPADLGAAMVELDLYVQPQGDATTKSHLRIWGASIRDMGQANVWVGQPVKVSGGMGRGLPLANPAQSGLLIQGSIYQAYGNWVGTDQYLNFVLGPPDKSNLVQFETPSDVSINWPEGGKMSDAIRQALTTAFPSYTININIKDNLVQPGDKPGILSTIGQIAQWAKENSKSIIGQNYLGIQITFDGMTINVSDGSQQKSPKSIAFTDLIGQPTWVEPLKVSAAVVMRADIKQADLVTLPPTAVTTAQAGAPRIGDSLTKQSSIFQGTFFVNSVHHVGSSRSPDGRYWATMLELSSQASGSLGAAASATAVAPNPSGGWAGDRVPY